MTQIDQTLPTSPLPIHPLRLKIRSFRSYQWQILITTMVCYLFFYTGRHTFGFAIPGIEQELGLTKETLGWCGTALLWSCALGQAINGNLADRFGGRILITSGAILSTFLNWGMSFASSLTTLLIPWTLNGLAQAMSWAPGSRVLSNWWAKEERGKVYGLYSFSAGMASVVAFLLASTLLSFDLNWRWIFRLPVLGLFAVGVLYFLLVRDKPSEMGFNDLRNQSDEPEVQETSTEYPENFWTRYSAVFKEKRFMIASVSFGFLSLSRYGLLIWVPVHFLGPTWKNGHLGEWLSLALPLGMGLGALISGWLTDNVFKSKRWPVICLFMSLAAITCTGMIFVDGHLIPSLVLLFFSGLFVFGPGPAYWALAPDLLGPKLTGTGSGVMNTFAYSLAGFGSPFIGWMIMQCDNNTLVIFPIVAISSALAALIGLFIRR